MLRDQRLTINEQRSAIDDHRQRSTINDQRSNIEHTLFLIAARLLLMVHRLSLVFDHAENFQKFSCATIAQKAESLTTQFWAYRFIAKSRKGF